MAHDWEKFCRARDLSVEESTIEVTFGDQRRHAVTVRDEGETYLLCARIAGASLVEHLEGLPRDAWIRNRSSSLVGFRIDHRGRLVGEAWVPKVGLTAEEFQLYVRAVARESDRFEFVLTGRDLE